jgi:hypothetical protein
VLAGGREETWDGYAARTQLAAASELAVAAGGG